MEVVLAVVAVVVLALIAWAVVKRQRSRRLEGRREEAGELRQSAVKHEREGQRREASAEQRAARAKQEAAAADEEAERARAAKVEAAHHQERAVEVDPDADESGNGRTPSRETSPQRSR